MLTLHVHFLTGRYTATAYNDRSRAEWPPHPARLYSALVDALHGDDQPDAAARAALDALAASAAPPIVVASEAHPRSVMTHFVPVNDTAVTDEAALSSREKAYRLARSARAQGRAAATPAQRKKLARKYDAAIAALEKRSLAAARAPSTVPKDNPAGRAMPWSRPKQPRTFPTMLPVRERCALVWSDVTLPRPQYDALGRIASQVVRLGHSSSLVHVHITAEEPAAAGGDGTDDTGDVVRWLFDPDGDAVLRLPLAGQRQALENAFARHGGDVPGRVMPARHVRYSVERDGPRVGTTHRSDGRFIVYQLTASRTPPASSAVAVASGVRQQLLRSAGVDAHPILSGRDGDKVLQAPHLAIVPLPFVGHPHADGAIRGFALSLPSAATPDAEQALLAALGRWEAPGDAELRSVSFPIHSGELRATRLVDPATGLKTLRRGRWARASARWGSVTPIALDGECDRLNDPRPAVRRKAHRTAAKLVRRAVARAITPPEGTTMEPDEIGVSLVFDCPVPGGAHLRGVPHYQRPGHARPRRLVHAVIELPFPVRGPLLLGSGRHLGLGLCAPLPTDRSRQETP